MTRELGGDLGVARDEVRDIAAGGTLDGLTLVFGERAADGDVQRPVVGRRKRHGSISVLQFGGERGFEPARHDVGQAYAWQLRLLGQRIGKRLDADGFALQQQFSKPFSAFGLTGETGFDLRHRHDAPFDENLAEFAARLAELVVR